MHFPIGLVFRVMYLKKLEIADGPVACRGVGLCGS
jgi:hypothetical protein